MKRVVIESAILAALVWSLAACERDAASAGRNSSTQHERHDATAAGQALEVTDGGPREVAPAAPLQMPTGGTGGTGGTYVTGTGGTGGTYTTGTGGSGGTVTGGTGGLGGTGGTFFTR